MSTLSLADALDTVTAALALPEDEAPLDDALQLAVAIERIALEAGAESATRVLEALILEEFKTLTWRPFEGVHLVRSALTVGAFDADVLANLLVYVNLYYQELDEPVIALRDRLAAGAPVGELAADFARVLDEAFAEVGAP